MHHQHSEVHGARSQIKQSFTGTFKSDLVTPYGNAKAIYTLYKSAPFSFVIDLLFVYIVLTATDTY